jgi:hypothetical protein
MLKTGLTSDGKKPYSWSCSFNNRSILEPQGGKHG